MKGSIFFVAVFILALLMIPMIGLSVNRSDAVLLPVQAPALTQEPATPAIEQYPPYEQEAEALPALREEEPEEEMPPANEPGSGQDTVRAVNSVSDYGVTEFKILDTATGKVNVVPLRDFVRGAVAAEMPAGFHAEALKAQAVAAHTFALHNHLVQQAHPDPALKGADFAANPSGMEVYITEKTAKKFYGEQGDLYWAKICDAADSVVTYILEYEDEPIVAAYHAISAGKTEDAANVWQGSAPYLQAAESPGDLLAPHYETTAVFTQEQVKTKLKAAYPQINLSGEAKNWFGKEERSESGYITSISVGGVELHGKDIRTVFGLRSHNINIRCLNDRFSFTVYGYGHGIGLSQYGADFMARQGATFDEILSNYYTGVALKQVSLQ